MSIFETQYLPVVQDVWREREFGSEPEEGEVVKSDDANDGADDDEASGERKDDELGSLLSDADPKVQQTLTFANKLIKWCEQELAKQSSAQQQDVVDAIRLLKSATTRARDDMLERQVAPGRPREVAVVGDNGAGKSFLINLLVMLTAESECDYERLSPQIRVKVLQLLRRFRGDIKIHELRMPQDTLEQVYADVFAMREQLVKWSLGQLSTRDNMDDDDDDESGGDDDEAAIDDTENNSDEMMTDDNKNKNKNNKNKKNKTKNKNISTNNNNNNKNDNDDVDEDGGGLKLYLTPIGSSTTVTTPLSIRLHYAPLFWAIMEYIDQEQLAGQLAAALEQIHAANVAQRASSIGGAGAGGGGGVDSANNSETTKRDLAYALWQHVTTLRTRAEIDALAAVEVHSAPRDRANKALDLVRDDVRDALGTLVVALGAGGAGYAQRDRVALAQWLQLISGLGGDVAQRRLHRRLRFVVRSVHVFAPAAILRGMTLVDTPGFKDADPLSQLLQQQSLERADVVLALLNERGAKENSNYVEALDSAGVIERLTRVSTMRRARESDNNNASVALAAAARAVRVVFASCPERHDSQKGFKIRFAGETASGPLRSDARVQRRLYESVREVLLSRIENVLRRRAYTESNNVRSTTTMALDAPSTTNYNDEAIALFEARVAAFMVAPLSYASLQFASAEIVCAMSSNVDDDDAQGENIAMMSTSSTVTNRVACAPLDELLKRTHMTQLFAALAPTLRSEAARDILPLLEPLKALIDACESIASTTAATTTTTITSTSRNVVVDEASEVTAQHRRNAGGFFWPPQRNGVRKIRWRERNALVERLRPEVHEHMRRTIVAVLRRIDDVERALASERVIDELHAFVQRQAPVVRKRAALDNAFTLRYRGRRPSFDLVGALLAALGRCIAFDALSATIVDSVVESLAPLVAMLRGDLVSNCVGCGGNDDESVRSRRRVLSMCATWRDDATAHARRLCLQALAPDTLRDRHLLDQMYVGVEAQLKLLTRDATLATPERLLAHVCDRAFAARLVACCVSTYFDAVRSIAEQRIKLLWRRFFDSGRSAVLYAQYYDTLLAVARDERATPATSVVVANTSTVSKKTIKKKNNDDDDDDDDDDDEVTVIDIDNDDDDDDDSSSDDNAPVVRERLTLATLKANAETQRGELMTLRARMLGNGNGEPLMASERAEAIGAQISARISTLLEAVDAVGSPLLPSSSRTRVARIVGSFQARPANLGELMRAASAVGAGGAQVVVRSSLRAAEVASAATLLNRTLRPHKLHCVQLLPEANGCLFRALCHSMQNVDSDVMQRALRRHLTSLVFRQRRNFDISKAEFAALRGASAAVASSSMSFEEYCRELANETLRGDEMALRLFARVTQYDVMVWRVGSARPLLISGGSSSTWTATTTTSINKAYHVALLGENVYWPVRVRLAAVNNNNRRNASTSTALVQRSSQSTTTGMTTLRVAPSTPTTSAVFVVVDSCVLMRRSADVAALVQAAPSGSGGVQLIVLHPVLRELESIKKNEALTDYDRRLARKAINFVHDMQLGQQPTATTTTTTTTMNGGNARATTTTTTTNMSPVVLARPSALLASAPTYFDAALDEVQYRLRFERDRTTDHLLRLYAAALAGRFAPACAALHRSCHVLLLTSDTVMAIEALQDNVHHLHVAPRSDVAHCALHRIVRSLSAVAPERRLELLRSSLDDLPRQQPQPPPPPLLDRSSMAASSLTSLSFARPPPPPPSQLQLKQPQQSSSLSMSSFGNNHRNAMSTINRQQQQQQPQQQQRQQLQPQRQQFQTPQRAQQQQQQQARPNSTPRRRTRDNNNDDDDDADRDNVKRRRSTSD